MPSTPAKFSSIAEFFPKAGIEGLAKEVEDIVLQIVKEAC
jgi:hypothetical protein